MSKKEFVNEINWKKSLISNITYGRRHSKPFTNMSCFVGQPVVQLLLASHLLTRVSNRNSVLELHAVPRYCAQFLDVFRARNYAQVESTCAGNPTINQIWFCVMLQSLIFQDVSSQSLQYQLGVITQVLCNYKLSNYF